MRDCPKASIGHAFGLGIASIWRQRHGMQYARRCHNIIPGTPKPIHRQSGFEAARTPPPPHASLLLTALRGRPYQVLLASTFGKYLPTSTCGQVLVLAQVLAQVLVQVLVRAQVLADKYLPTSTCGQVLVLAQVLSQVLVQVFLREQVLADNYPPTPAWS